MYPSQFISKTRKRYVHSKIGTPFTQIEDLSWVLNVNFHDLVPWHRQVRPAFILETNHEIISL